VLFKTYRIKAASQYQSKV